MRGAFALAFALFCVGLAGKPPVIAQTPIDIQSDMAAPIAVNSEDDIPPRPKNLRPNEMRRILYKEELFFEYVDTRSQHEFYYNPRTRETTWFLSLAAGEVLAPEMVETVIEDVFGREPEGKTGFIGENGLDPAGELRFQDFQTAYDGLKGIAMRGFHPPVQEPGVDVLFEEAGGAENAQSELEQQLMDGPDNPLTWNDLGNVWRVKGNAQRAIDCFRKALSLRPEYSQPALNLAVVIHNYGFIDDAIEIIASSIQVHREAGKGKETDLVLHHFSLGQLLLKKGRKHEALVFFKNSVELEPAFESAKGYIQTLSAELHAPTAESYAAIWWWSAAATVLSLAVGILFWSRQRRPAPEPLKPSKRKKRCFH